MRIGCRDGSYKVRVTREREREKEGVQDPQKSTQSVLPLLLPPLPWALRSTLCLVEETQPSEGAVLGRCPEACLCWGAGWGFCLRLVFFSLSVLFASLKTRKSKQVSAEHAVRHSPPCPIRPLLCAWSCMVTSCCGAYVSVHVCMSASCESFIGPLLPFHLC